MRVTVAILTRNRLTMLGECIDSIRPLLRQDDEILIVDTGSTDGTREWLGNHPQATRSVLMAPGEGSFAEARNVAVREAAGEIVAFTDDDCIVAEDWLARIRAALRDYDAVGGLSIPGRTYSFPRWWSDDISWAIGMTGPGVVMQRPGSYPVGANIAARRDVLLQHPFARVAHSFQQQRAYLGGREDAHWWRSARVTGLRLLIDPQLTVFHRIPAERISFSYVWGRAGDDGRAEWRREPVPARVPIAAYECANSFIRTITHLPRNLAESVESLVWARRQWTYTVEASGIAAVPKIAGAAAVAFRRRAMRRYVKIVSSKAKLEFVLPAQPGRVIVMAPTFVGDSIALQSALYGFARQWPNSTIQLVTNYPILFPDPPENISILGVKNAAEVVRSSLDRGALVFVPYYHHGDIKLWRNVLSPYAITFNREVGFRRSFDYHYAARVVQKKTRLRESLAIAQLLQQWDRKPQIEMPRLSLSSSVLERVFEFAPTLKDNPYVTVQIGSGDEMKDWPIQSWEQLVDQFCVPRSLVPVFVGSVEWKGVADEMISRHPTWNAVNLAGQPLDELIATISRARLAIGVCSGPKHLAFALNVPTFTLYGPTDPAQWGPCFHEELHGFIRSPVPYLTSWEHAGLPRNHTMRALTPEAVIHAMEQHWESLHI